MLYRNKNHRNLTPRPSPKERGEESLLLDVLKVPFLWRGI